MPKPTKYDHPTNTYPYKIPRRLNLLSVPRKTFFESMEGMPGYTDMGIRKSALRGVPTDRVNDISWPWVRRLMLIKKVYKNRFSPERLERLERMIESANATMYSKMANCVVALKKQDAGKDMKKKRGWSESEWKKHMDYIANVAAPKKTFHPPPIKRGKSMPLESLMPRINEIAALPQFKCYIRQSKEAWYRDPIKRGKSMPLEVLLPRIEKISTRPEFKCYKKMSEEIWYRDPIKVSPQALKYEITDRIKKLAVARVTPITEIPNQPTAKFK